MDLDQIDRDLLQLLSEITRVRAALGEVLWISTPHPDAWESLVACGYVALDAASSSVLLMPRGRLALPTSAP